MTEHATPEPLDSEEEKRMKRDAFVPLSEASSTAEVPPPAGATAVAPGSTGGRGNTMKLLLVLALAGLLALGGWFAYSEMHKRDAPAGERAPAAIPLEKGQYIALPDNVDGGLTNAKKAADKTKAVKDPSAPRYIDPKTLSDYRTVDKAGNVTLKAPVDGACARGAKGQILPPDNYYHVCYYTVNGAVFYTSHAVLGPRTGALENIQYLRPGQIVTLNGVKYEVSNIYVFLADDLPPFLTQRGTISLVTCHIDASVKSFSDYTKTDVVTLVRAK